MSKAILVIDMPESCDVCPLCVSDEYGLYLECPLKYKGYVEKRQKPDWCPLKPIPEKEYADTGILEVDEFAAGWNNCIDVILEE